MNLPAGRQVNTKWKAEVIKVEVTPVLVFANKFIKLRFCLRPVNGVYVIGTSWLLNLIQERQITLTPEQCIKVKDEIKKYISII